MQRVLSLGFLSLLFAAIFANAASASFSDLETTMEYARWSDYRKALDNLVGQFDAINGDTFAEGDFPPSSVSFTCSVDDETQQVKSCAWLFGRDGLSVDEETGVISDESFATTCHFKIGMKADAFTRFLAYPDSLDKPIPGTDASFYDGLVNCL